MEFYENTLLQYKDGKTIRVVFNNRLSAIIYVIDMKAKRWAYPVEKETIRFLIKSEGISILKEDPFHRQVVEEDLTNAERERRDRAWKVVNFVFEQIEEEEQIFITKYREMAIKKAIAMFQMNYSTIKNYLVSYWHGGKIRNSLLGSFHLCGGRGKEKKANGKKRGRQSADGSRQGINIDENIKKYFKVGLNRYYYSAKQNSLKTAYELTIRDFLSTEEVNSNGEKKRVLKEGTKIPTYSQFLYWYKKFNDSKKEISKRHGSRIYHQKYRGIIGNSTQDAGLGPATLWQTDSTPLDIFCVSSINRGILVGKPLLHMVIDGYSRMIVGFSLTYESLNSYSGAMMALLNSMTPKKEFCKQYGVDIEDDWNVACVPQKVFTDRGELNGKQIEGSIEGLGISIQNAPSYFPQTKGTIESMFYHMTARIKPHVDGVISGNRVRERGEVDNRLKANLTIEEVTAILIRCIIFYNNFHIIEDYPLTEEMIEHGVEKIPREIWEFGLKNQKGQLRVLPQDVIKMHLLPTDNSASITSKGVKFRKMLYASEYSLKNNWFQTARIEGSKKIRIWYNPRDLTSIYTISEENHKFHKLTLVDHLVKYKQKGIEEVEQIIKYEQAMDSKGKERELQEKIKLFDDIEKIVNEAKEKTEAEQDGSISKTRKIKGIKENQRLERLRLRELSKSEVSLIDVPLEVTDKVEEVEDHLDLFRQLREEEGV
ncbi:TPA: transposase family protein [Salmonella enterica subsp. enterica serovar Typhimurium var. 5-]|uniref:Transposase family protein n=1 Tax=Salmonella enterica subsp. enterica serovar Typhimurium var. 5- TaxID=1620419 RepID=A0A740PMH0_SALTM|nr:transposase family protein [Salmonella enterica subsp. enterica serovar Typhimurium var. 5-]